MSVIPTLDKIAASPAPVKLGGRSFLVAPLDDYHLGLLANCLREQIVSLGYRAAVRAYNSNVREIQAAAPSLRESMLGAAKEERAGMERMAMQWATSLVRVQDANAMLGTPEGIADLLWCGLLAAGGKQDREEVAELGTPQERLAAAWTVSRLTWGTTTPVEEALREAVEKKSDASADPPAGVTTPAAESSATTPTP